MCIGLAGKHQGTERTVTGVVRLTNKVWSWTPPGGGVLQAKMEILIDCKLQSDVDFDLNSVFNALLVGPLWIVAVVFV